MCGILGFFGIRGGMARSTLDRMRDAMAHRGPDGACSRLFYQTGVVVKNNDPGFAGLGHRRLSIIDLTDTGSQPMANEDDTLWITYNGEFYNFQDYRTELEAKGHVFQSQCDTETILHLYEEYGIEPTLARMNGMFAFGLYDVKRRRLILARDRAGKKPLYYAHVDGGIIFASEIKGLLASGRIDRRRWSEEAVADSLTIGTPLGEHTMFEQIKLLSPGHYAIWEDGKLTIRQYYIHPMERIEPEERPVDDMVDELEALLVDAIRIRLIADVPVGLFLSGGVDSSLIAALTKKKLGRDIHTYCISFEQDGYDESAYAKQVAEHLDLPIHMRSAGTMGPDTYERIARHIDQPLGDASLVPTYLVSRCAHEAGVKTILTGDGGDEMFGGYDTYMRALNLWDGKGYRNAKLASKSWGERRWEAQIAGRGFERGYIALQNQFSIRHRLYLCRSPRQAWSAGVSSDRRRLAHFERIKPRPLIDRMQYSDMKTIMTDVILRKVDLMSMANSLECRSPFLDYRVMEFSARLPVAAKVSPQERSKVILRRLLRRYLPDEVFNRPKMGFCMPWETICTGSYAESLKARWRTMDAPHLRSEAGDWLFDEGGVGGMFRKWAAFTQLVFFEQTINYPVS